MGFKAAFVKDIKLLFRNRASFLLALLGPIILILILTMAFSNLGFNDIKIGYIYSPEAELYNKILPQLSYVGTFIPYQSLAECKNDLRVQYLHLCLEPTGNMIYAHFDNTRELISLILLNQVRVAVNAERESVFRTKTADFIGQVNTVANFLNSSGSHTDLLMENIAKQRSDLLAVRKDILSTEKEINHRISELEKASAEISSMNSDGQRISDDIFSEADTSLSAADSAISQASSLISDTPASQKLSQVKSRIQNARSQLQSAKSIIDEQFDNIDELLDSLDDALYSMRQARQLLIENERRILTAIERLDASTQDLSNMRSNIYLHENNLNVIGSVRLEDVVNPLILGYSPLFTGSERIKNINIGALTEKQKSRLLNFGTVQTFLPLIIILLICFIATILSNILLLEEIHSPAFLRNQLLPGSWMCSFLSLLFVVLLVTGLQAGLIFLVGQVIFGLDIVNVLGTVVLTAGLLIVTYSVIGMTLALIIHTKTTSLLVSAFFLITNILLGGVAYPVERMAPFMCKIAEIIPFTSGISMLQQSLFYQVPFSELIEPFAVLIILFVVFLLLLFGARFYFMCRYVKGL